MKTPYRRPTDWKFELLVWAMIAAYVAVLVLLAWANLTV